MLSFLQKLVSWPVLSVLLGLILLAAAALKGHEIATTELLKIDLLSSRWFLVLVVEWEIFFSWSIASYFASRRCALTPWHSSMTPFYRERFHEDATVV